MIKKKENILYILFGEIFLERYGFRGQSATITSLNIYIYSNIRFLFGQQVPSESIESLTIDIIGCNAAVSVLEDILVLWRKVKKVVFIDSNCGNLCLVSWPGFSAGEDKNSFLFIY